MKRFKIGVIGLKGIPAKSGADRVFESITKYLYDEFDITVYCKRGYTDYSETVKGVERVIIPTIGIKNIDIAFHFLMSALHALFLRSFDIVHIHNIDCAYVLPLLYSKYRNRILSTSHGSPYKRDKWSRGIKIFFRFMEEIFIRFSDTVTSVSLPLKWYYEKRYKREVLYVPNGVNKEEEISTTLIDRYMDERKISRDYILFSAGRIIPTKGCHILLQALRVIKYHGDLLIVGDLQQSVEYTKELMRLAPPNTHFLGLIESKGELLGIIKRAKIFIFPSTYEAMAMTLLEGASVGVPIIASDIPENRAIFDPKELLYFKSGDYKDLASKIEWGLKNYSDMIERSKLARLHMKNDYLWDNIAIRYACLYRQMLEVVYR